MQTRNKYAMVVNKYARMVVAMINDIFGTLELTYEIATQQFNDKL